jgi:hypothetical protein
MVPVDFVWIVQEDDEVIVDPPLEFFDELSHGVVI